MIQITFQLPVSTIGLAVLLINFGVYILVHPLTFLGVDMTRWNIFHKVMWILGLGLIVIGCIK
jgi:hypothetical protein